MSNIRHLASKQQPKQQLRRKNVDNQQRQGGWFFFSSWVIKARTIAIVTLGVTIVIQFSTETYLYAALHNKHNNDYDALSAVSKSLMTARRAIRGGQEESKFLRRSDDFLPILNSNRYGYASKDSLRTSPNSRILHYETKPLIIAKLQRQQKSMLRNHPRIVYFIDDDDKNKSNVGNGNPLLSSLQENQQQSHDFSKKKRSVDPIGPQKQQQQGLEDIDDDDQGTTVLDFEKPFLEECTPILDMPQVHPTCNGLHELHLDTEITLLSTKGSWRTVWTTTTTTHGNNENQEINHEQTTTKEDTTTKVALKMLNLHRTFDDESFYAHSTDIMVMDRLTSSPYVIDAYSYCGNSVITEFATSGGRDQVKSYDLRNRERLKIARDLAKGLAEIQSLSHSIKGDDYSDTTESTSTKKSTTQSPILFAHNDINIANTVYVDGKIKWNDFNIGVLMRKNKHDQVITNNTETSTTTLTTCDAPVKYRSDLWRSPEEIRNTSYVDLTKTDMYGFGNILYQVMTRHQPWTHKEPGGQLTLEEVAMKKRDGQLPTIPEIYKNTSKTELQVLTIATVSCYHPNPAKRPSAKELANALSVVYDKLQKKKPVTSKLIFDLFVKQ